MLAQRIKQSKTNKWGGSFFLREVYKGVMEMTSLIDNQSLDAFWRSINLEVRSLTILMIEWMADFKPKLKSSKLIQSSTKDQKSLKALRTTMSNQGRRHFGEEKSGNLLKHKLLKGNEKEVNCVCKYKEFSCDCWMWNDKLFLDEAKLYLFIKN